MIDPNVIRQNVIMQQIGGMADVAKTAVSSQTKTTEKLPETLESAKSKGAESTHPVAKKAAAIVGGLIGLTLKPFVFNEGKARAELSSKFDKFDFTNTDAITLKSMRNDLRTIEKIANKYGGKEYQYDGALLDGTLDNLKNGDQVYGDSLSTKLTGAYSPSLYPKIEGVKELANQLKALKESAQSMESHWKTQELQDILGKTF